jgi:hypothetical protein
MTHLISLSLFAAGALAYAIHELHAHGKLKWAKEAELQSFWGRESWARKWADSKSIRWPAPSSYYYKLFNLAYKEKFPSSATVFVALTDGSHLMQFIYLLCFSGAIAAHHERWLLWLIAYRLAFGIVFTLGYRTLAK